MSVAPRTFAPSALIAALLAAAPIQAQTSSGPTLENTSTNASAPYHFGRSIIGQSFKTPTRAGSLASITVLLTRETFNGGQLFLYLYESPADALQGKTPIAKSQSIVYRVGQENVLSFPAPVALKPDTEYAFVLNTSGQNFFSVASANNNPYAGGQLVRGNGALGREVDVNPAKGFAADPTADLWFKTNITWAAEPPENTQANASTPYHFGRSIVGQSFRTLSGGGILDSITVRLTRDAFNGGELGLSLYESSADEVNGKTPIAASQVIVYRVGEDNVLAFPAPPVLKPNTDYTFLFYTHGQNFFSFASANNNPYLSGKLVIGGGALGQGVQLDPASGFTADATADLWFKANVR
jgi:hypothetical protein